MGRLRDAIPMDVRHRIARTRVRLRVPTGRFRVLPDVLVIGAQRAGTSSLYRYLGAHPDVVASVRKEVEYFTRRYRLGERWYRAHFPLALPWLGTRSVFEATPDYLFHPAAAARAVETLPGARIVVLLRDPVERAWSHHGHMVRLGYETLGFADALEAEDDRIAADLARVDDAAHDPKELLRFSYRSRGRYAEQLERWFEHYPRDRVLVLWSDDLFNEPVATYRRLLVFLGLRDKLPSSFPNVSARPGSAGSAGPAGSAGSAGPAPTMDPLTRAQLTASYVDGDERLAELLGTIPPWRARRAVH
jgi:hypothetical protein